MSSFFKMPFGRKKADEKVATKSVDVDKTVEASPTGSSDAAQCGISLQYFRKFFREHAAEHPDMTTREVVESLIKNATAGRQCRYTDLLEGSADVWWQYKRKGGTPRLFVIVHAWDGVHFSTLVNRLNERFHHEKDTENIFLWLDMFAINQWRPSEDVHDQDAIKRAIQLCTSTLVVLDVKALPLTRLWCLYEIALADRASRPLELLSHNKDTAAMRVFEMDLARAECFAEASRQVLNSRFTADGGSLQDVSNSLRQSLNRMLLGDHPTAPMDICTPITQRRGSAPAGPNRDIDQSATAAIWPPQGEVVHDSHRRRSLDNRRKSLDRNREKRTSTNEPAPASLECILGRGTEDLEDYYSIGRELGRGVFGITYECMDVVSGETYACKAIAKSGLKTQQMVDGTRKEVQVMLHLQGHRNIVEIMAVFEDPTHLYVVMEICRGGELFQSIAKKGHFSEKKAARIFRSMLLAIMHCHSMGVVHRDLKPENFLLTNDTDEAELKAADFGLARFFKQGEKLTEGVGNVMYAAPELLKRNYGPEVDVWSMGVLLYIMLCGRPPFHGPNDMETVKRIMQTRPDFTKDPWPSISADAKDLIQKLLVHDVSKRLTPEQALKHPWIHTTDDAIINSEVLTRMRQFTCHQKLKQLGLLAMVEHLDEDEVEGLRQIFQDLDTSRSGHLSVQELQDGLRRRGVELPQAELAQLVKSLGNHESGTIDYQEFLAATVHTSKLGYEENIHAAFQEFDPDGLGYITASHVEQFMHKLGMHCDRKDAEEMLAPVDTDHDGRVDFDQFFALMAPERSDRRTSYP